MNYYNQIKDTLTSVQVYKRIKDYSKNKYELEKYYEVGKLLIEAQGGEGRNEYGNKLIKQYAYKLTNELGKGYSWRNLYNMRLFYLKFKNKNILQAVTAKLSWTHLNELFRLKNENEINYYIKITISGSLSYRQLHEKIKSNEYERLNDKSKLKLVFNEDFDIEDNLKHPIIIKNTHDTKVINEEALKQLILEDIVGFMAELGEGFSFIKSEYPIKLGNRYNYLDLLLFSIKYNCYVVIELKVTELKKEHIGQIKLYMNYIDKCVKTIYHDKTIGIIITKRDNKFVMEYCSDERIFRTTYQLI